MLISVVMSVFNDAPYLDAAVRSIREQEFADFEFLIVNDGSTDGSTEILRAHAREDRRIRLIEQENRGLVASLNRAIGDARGRLVARMDGDDRSLPERFGRQVAYLQAKPDVGVVGAQIRLIDATGRRIKDAVDYPRDPAAFVAALHGKPVMSHPAAMIVRSHLEAVGGYRPQFRHCEDYDLWLRLSERTRLCSLDEILLEYRVNPDQVSTRHLMEQQTGAAIAWEAHVERQAGRRDPIAELAALPAIDDLDALFGRAGVTASVRSKVAQEIIYSLSALTGGGVRLLLDHVGGGGAAAPVWRTVARLARHGHFGNALRLGAGLLRSGHAARAG